MRSICSVLALLLGSAAIGACSSSDPDENCRTLFCQVATGAGGGSTTGTPDDSPCVGDACPKAKGEECSSAAACSTGICADGVCCDAPCDGSCEACNQDGKMGNCMPLPAGAKDPKASTCDDLGGCGEIRGYCRCEDGVKNGDETAADCGGFTCKSRCGGGSSCQAGSGADCISGFCVDGLCCNTDCQGTCFACDAPDHPGLCSPVLPGTTDACSGGSVCGVDTVCAAPTGGVCLTNAQCASRHCVATVCAECGEDADCSNNQVCVNGACFSKAPTGQGCPADAACSSGHCVDGVCCESSCDGACMACHTSYTGQQSGVCAPMLAGYDPHVECAGPGGAAVCSGEAAANGQSSCAQ